MGKHQKKRNAPKPRLVDSNLSDSEDEEIPEDEAFNSDDERKYGSFFQDREEDDGSDADGSDVDDRSEGSDDGDGSAASDDDEEEDDGDGGQYMLDLLDKLDKKAEDHGGKRKEELSAGAAISANVKESEFSSSVVKKASLTLDSLMDGLEGTKGFGVMQKQMKDVARGSATTAPLARVVADRELRKIHYEDQSKDVSQWLDAVQQNRQAETLDFRPKERMEVTRDILVEKFVPTTEFEKHIHAALEEAGQKDEEALLKAEESALQDDLGASSITLEEYKKRRGQLAKMRSLLFSYEQKRAKMKKIKSKKYRRIRKRQRERLMGAELEARADEDPDAVARELQEKEEIERMKERASLAHKNTSKWAKRILKRGKNVDVDTRRALSAQLKRGDDLVQRMKGTRGGGEGDEDDSEDDEDLVDTACKVLADTEDGEDGSGAASPVKGSGLFKLSFMQKGIEKQRQKAREEARQLLQELEDDGSDNLSDDVDEDMPDQEGAGKHPPKVNNKPKVASKEDMKNVLGQGEMVVSQLKHGKSNAVAISGEINIDALEKNATKNQVTTETKQNTGTVSIHTGKISIQTSSGDKQKGAEKKKAVDTTKTTTSMVSSDNHRKKAASTAPQQGKEDSNPWLVEGRQKAVASERKAKRSTSQKYMVDVERAIDLLEPAPPNKQDKEDSEGEGTCNTSSNNDRIITLTQEELVKRAFATAAEKEADEDFAKEKEAVEQEEEDPTRRNKRKKGKGADNCASAVSDGWGSWAGMGAPPPKPPRRKLPKRLQAPERKPPKRKRADEKKPNVIISEKRVKRTADKFMLAQVPYPFTSREEYERSMSGGVGKEWNVTGSFKDMTRPAIITRAGKVIQPLSKKVKHKRPAAKF